MKVLVIGNGAREHTILWKLSQSPRHPELYAAPGNAGTDALAINLAIPSDHVDSLIRAVHEFAIDLTIVGPEAPLAAGVVDRFRAEGLSIFGATQAAAQIETSKAFSKQLMAQAGVPTASFRIFDTYAKAASYVQLRGAPVVIKADGLAAGKGVVVAGTVDEALVALDDIMIKRAFGAAGNHVIVEDCLVGQEVSIFAFTDGVNVSPLVAACDYKRIGDGEQGPNTGGMGAYSPPIFWSFALEQQLREAVMIPVIKALAKAGTPYTGVLYGGIILTDTGPQVLEFNARLGDPETQVVLPRLENDLLDVVEAVLSNNLANIDLRWSSDACVGVVLAAGGYPGVYEIGRPLTGLDSLSSNTMAFHAGTIKLDGVTATSGGRVMTIVGRGASLADARGEAYAAIKDVDFEGAYHRSDIASFGK
jgi:phosphoribosylamine--glycine ligase